MLAKFIGGSHLYGLHNKDSDLDWRGCFLSDDISYILGLKKGGDCDHATRIDGDDHTYYELRRLMELLRKTNTSAIEFLFVPENQLLETSAIFSELRANKEKFTDSARLLASTRGYVQSEKRLALGERTGRLGSKRKVKLEQFGFSPKNVTQIIRIIVATKEFVKTGYYPLDISEVDRVAFGLAKQIKNDPGYFERDEIVSIIRHYEDDLMAARDEVELKFDNDAANDLLCGAYFETIKNYDTRHRQKK